MFKSGYKFGVVDTVVFMSQTRRNVIREESDKLADYYRTHPTELIDSMLSIKNADNPEDDIYINDFKNRAEKVIDNLGNNSFSMKEEYLIDNYQKVHHQISLYPTEHLMQNENINIFFYELLLKPDPTTGIRLILSCLSLNWKLFLDYYMRSCN